MVVTGGSDIGVVLVGRDMGVGWSLGIVVVGVVVGIAVGLVVGIAVGQVGAVKDALLLLRVLKEVLKDERVLYFFVGKP